MEVNEKCDVYSFGILSLEVIMGRHPGDIMSSLSASSSSSSNSIGHGILLKDLLDKRLSPPKKQVAEEVVFVVKLAFACLHPNAASRPNMKQVSMQLSKPKTSFQNAIDTITLGQLLDVEC